MKEEAISVFEKKGLDASIKFIKNQKDISEAAMVFDEMVRYAYWKKQDLNSFVEFAQAGISFNSARAKKTTGDGKEQYLSNLKQISYNLASFTWPGWDEEWLGNIPENYLKLGYEAAKTNLHYAKELNKNDLVLSKGYWIIAAHQLVSGEYHQAEENFNQSAAFAVKAEQKSNELLSLGFMLVAQLLAKPKNTAAFEKLNSIKAELKKIEHGNLFIKQLEDSLRIFS